MSVARADASRTLCTAGKRRKSQTECLRTHDDKYAQGNKVNCTGKKCFCAVSHRNRGRIDLGGQANL